MAGSLRLPADHSGRVQSGWRSGGSINSPPCRCRPDVPIRDVLAFPPQPITSPLAIEAADSSFTGIDFVPDSFAQGPVQRGAALYALEGDFGFSRGECRTPEVGHEIKLLNFSKVSEPLQLQISRFAFNQASSSRPL